MLAILSAIIYNYSIIVQSTSKTARCSWQTFGLQLPNYFVFITLRRKYAL